MNKRFLLYKILFTVLFCNSFYSKSQNIVIQTKNIALVYKITDTKNLVQLYFGKKFADTSDYSVIAGRKAEAFPAGGSIYIHEPAIEVTHTDANPSLQLIYSGNTIDNKNG
ncbi:MAG: hypothetical protein ABI863_14025, partial [Ginsengibacter sp.]